MAGKVSNFGGKKATPFVKGKKRRKAVLAKAVLRARKGARRGADLAFSDYADAIDLGKNGSKWRHGYIPENAAAVALKIHKSKGGKPSTVGDLHGGHVGSYVHFGGNRSEKVHGVLSEVPKKGVSKEHGPVVTLKTSHKDKRGNFYTKTHTIKASEPARVTRKQEGWRNADLSKLDAKARKRIDPSNFVFPKSKRYPIHDVSHARNALSRASGKPEEKVVRAAVVRKYPHLKNGGK